MIEQPGDSIDRSLHSHQILKDSKTMEKIKKVSFLNQEFINKMFLSLQTFFKFGYKE